MSDFYVTDTKQHKQTTLITGYKNMQNKYVITITIYNKSLLVHFFVLNTTLKTGNEFMGCTNIKKIKHRIEHGNLHKNCSTILDFGLPMPFNVVLDFAFKLV